MEKLFSVIILHYNQPQYVKTALDSVFNQNYDNIEIIFADDASKAIDVDDLKNYCEKNKKENIKAIKWQINEKNLGTVKSLNKAIDKAEGEYILFFAADDALFDENVLSNYVKEFKSASPDTYMISSQCYMMDESLKNLINKFVDVADGMEFNKLSALEQYRVFAKRCFLAIGSTAMRKQMFEDFGKFSEVYKLVEDWSYYLKLTREGGKIKFSNFNGLLHRNGGVSHTNTTDKVPPHIIEYRYDIVKILENEVFKYPELFSRSDRAEIYSFYKIYLKDFKDTKDTRKTAGLKSKLKFLGVAIFKYLIRCFFAYTNISKNHWLSLLIKLIVLWASFCILYDQVPGLLAERIFRFAAFTAFPVIIIAWILFLILVLLLTIILKIKISLKKDN